MRERFGQGGVHRSTRRCLGTIRCGIVTPVSTRLLRRSRDKSLPCRSVYPHRRGRARSAQENCCATPVSSPHLEWPSGRPRDLVLLQGPLPERQSRLTHVRCRRRSRTCRRHLTDCPVFTFRMPVPVAAISFLAVHRREQYPERTENHHRLSESDFLRRQRGDYACHHEQPSHESGVMGKAPRRIFRSHARLLADSACEFRPAFRRGRFIAPSSRRALCGGAHRRGFCQRGNTVCPPTTKPYFRGTKPGSASYLPFSRSAPWPRQKVEPPRARATPTRRTTALPSAAIA